MENFRSCLKFTSSICPVYIIDSRYYTTISAPIMDLNLHLEEFNEHVEVGVAAKELQRELKRRFKKLQIQMTAFLNTCFCWQLHLSPGTDLYLIQFKLLLPRLS